MTFWRHLFVGWLIACGALLLTGLIDGFTGWMPWWPDVFQYVVPIFGVVWVGLWLWRNSDPSTEREPKI